MKIWQVVENVTEAERLIAHTVTELVTVLTADNVNTVSVKDGLIVLNAKELVRFDSKLLKRKVMIDFGNKYNDIR